ncbi:hypothetical protein [Neisseria sp. Ec49-e6-T10]|uniref:hypothetical protein n=1 Tax=Neisseria sp. Ec49-e6-T10 TaxID=3140744 RepID=UPI003EBE288E
MKKIFFILVFGCFLISCSSKENLDEIHKKVDIFHAYYDKSEYGEIYYVMTSKEYKDSIAFKKT